MAGGAVIFNETASEQLIFIDCCKWLKKLRFHVDEGCITSLATCFDPAVHEIFIIFELNV